MNRISQGNPDWHADSRSAPKKVAGVLEVDQFTTLQAQIAAMQNHMITQVNNIKLGVPQEAATTNVVAQLNSWCEFCGSSENTAEACAVNPDSFNYIGNENRQGIQNYGNTYNPNYRNHPNFLWGGNQDQGNN